MEVLSSSFSSFFISSQMLDKDIYTHKELPGDQYRTAIQLWTVFFRLDPETLSRSLHQTTEKTPRVLNSANHMTNRWLFWNHRDSGWRSRTKLHQNICFVTRSTHTTDVFDMFSGAWGSFNLKIEIHELNTTKVSLGLLKSSGVLKESE